MFKQQENNFSVEQVSRSGWGWGREDGDLYMDYYIEDGKRKSKGDGRALKVDIITLTLLQSEESFFISPALGLPW